MSPGVTQSPVTCCQSTTAGPAHHPSQTKSRVVHWRAQQQSSHGSWSLSSIPSSSSSPYTTHHAPACISKTQGPQGVPRCELTSQSNQAAAGGQPGLTSRHSWGPRKREHSTAARGHQDKQQVCGNAFRRCMLLPARPTRQETHTCWHSGAQQDISAGDTGSVAGTSGGNYLPVSCPR